MAASFFQKITRARVGSQADPAEEKLSGRACQVGPYRGKDARPIWCPGGYYEEFVSEAHPEPRKVCFLSEFSGSPRKNDLRAVLDLAQSWRHPHLQPILDRGEHGDRCYWVIPSESRTLATLCHKGHALSLETSLKYTAQIIEALEFLRHQGIAYAALDADAVLLADETARLAILYCGLQVGLKPWPENWAHPTPMARSFQLHEAPEVRRGDRRPQSDQYPLALLVLHMLTGSAPFPPAAIHEVATRVLPQVLPPSGSMPTREATFEGWTHVGMALCAGLPELHELRPELPRSLSTVLKRMLSLEPEQRYPSLGAAGEALRGATADDSRLP